MKIHFTPTTDEPTEDGYYPLKLDDHWDVVEVFAKSKTFVITGSDEPDSYAGHGCLWGPRLELISQPIQPETDRSDSKEVSLAAITSRTTSVRLASAAQHYLRTGDQTLLRAFPAGREFLADALRNERASGWDHKLRKQIDDLARAARCHVENVILRHFPPA